MGQAKSQRARETEAAKYLHTVPHRIIKAIAGAILFLPMTFIAFGVECYRQNLWPWELK